MRLIDADKLQRKIQKLATESWQMKIKASVETTLNAFLDILDRQPTIKIVRCQHCKWWHDWNGECYAEEAQGFGHLWGPDDFCSYGDEKDEL